MWDFFRKQGLIVSEVFRYMEQESGKIFHNSAEKKFTFLRKTFL